MLQAEGPSSSQPCLRQVDLCCLEDNNSLSDNNQDEQTLNYEAMRQHDY